VYCLVSVQAPSLGIATHSPIRKCPCGESKMFHLGTLAMPASSASIPRYAMLECSLHRFGSLGVLFVLVTVYAPVPCPHRVCYPSQISMFSAVRTVPVCGRDQYSPVQWSRKTGLDLRLPVLDWTVPVCTNPCSIFMTVKLGN